MMIVVMVMLMLMVMFGHLQKQWIPSLWDAWRGPGQSQCRSQLWRPTCSDIIKTSVTRSWHSHYDLISPRPPAVGRTSVLQGLWLREPSERSRIRGCRGQSWPDRRRGKRRERGTTSARERIKISHNKYTPCLVAIQIKSQIEIHHERDMNRLDWSVLSYWEFSCCHGTPRSHW